MALETADDDDDNDRAVVPVRIRTRGLPAAGGVAWAAAHIFAGADPRQRLAVVPAAVAAFPDDDARLTGDGFSMLLKAGLAARPPKSLPLCDAGVLECLSPGEAHRCEPRLRALWSSELIVNLLLWLGARSAITGAVAGSEVVSHVLPLPAVAARLEARLERILRTELAAFASEAAAAAEGRPASLLTPRFAALQISLAWAATLGLTALSRSSVAVTFLKLLLFVWRASCFLHAPQHASLDDVVYREHFHFAVWLAHNTHAALRATGAIEEPLFDAAKEFGAVPLPLPFSLMADLPPSSGRPRKAPVPDIIAAVPRATFAEVVRITDPVRSPLPGGMHRRVLSRCASNLFAYGTSQFVPLVLNAHAAAAEFASWLRVRAGLSVLDVLVAEALSAFARADPALDMLPAGYLPALASNPHIAEAVSRRRRLADGVAAIERGLPTGLLDAVRGNDPELLARVVPPTVDMGETSQIVGYVTVLGLAGMLLVAPEPFADLSRVLPGDGESAMWDSASELRGGDLSGTLSSSSDSAGEDANPAAGLVRFWFSTPSCRLAAQLASSVSGNLRLLSRFPSRSAATLYVSCVSATSAAWMHLLLLRNFSALFSGADAASMSRALDIRALLAADVRACIAVLELPGAPQYASAASLLRQLLSDSGARITRGEMQLLRMARREMSGCRHAERGEDDGACWACLSGVRGDDPMAGIEAPEIPAGRSPQMAGSPGGKRVRFDAEVRVAVTWSADEYPGRSQRAADFVGEGGEEMEKERAARAAEKWAALSALRRGMQPEGRGVQA